jgi:ribosomal-protein-alanine acetyltransferase
MTGWRLRPATVDDLEAIMTLETSIFISDAWSPAGMRAELMGEHGHYLVAVEELGGDAAGRDAVIGYAGLLAPRAVDGSEAASDADIQTIAVAPGSRRRGIGSALLRALLDESARRGAEHVLLEVRADNPGAQDLYRSFGFEPIGVRRGYYQPDGIDAIVMRATVSFDRLRDRDRLGDRDELGDRDGLRDRGAAHER